MIDDARLIAYVDGELDARGRAEVEAALAADPLLAARLARHRELKIRLARTFDPVALEAVPERLRAAAGASSGPDNVVRLADRRTPPRVKTVRPFKWPAWSPIAASLAVGVIAGYALSHQDAGPLSARSDGVLAVQGDLARALDSDPTGEAGPIRVGLSFRTAANYCRAFQMDARRLAGVACKEGPGWVARMTTTTAPVAGPQPAYRTAASALPPAVLTAVGQMMVGQSLDRAGEDRARAKGWRN